MFFNQAHGGDCSRVHRRAHVQVVDAYQRGMERRDQSSDVVKFRAPATFSLGVESASRSWSFLSASGPEVSYVFSQPLPVCRRLSDPRPPFPSAEFGEMLEKSVRIPELLVTACFAPHFRLAVPLARYHSTDLIALLSLVFSMATTTTMTTSMAPSPTSTTAICSRGLLPRSPPGNRRGKQKKGSLILWWALLSEPMGEKGRPRGGSWQERKDE